MQAYRLHRSLQLLHRFQPRLQAWCCHRSTVWRPEITNLRQSLPASTVAQEQNRKTLQLRDYQEDSIKAVLSHLERGRKRLGISLATGSGKTVIFTQLIGRIPPPRPDATQTLILVHRRELVYQAAKHCSDAYPDQTINIEMGSSHASGAADITVASVQSITSGDRIEKFRPESFKLILVDEAHHIVAQQYLNVLTHFGLRPDVQPWAPALVGVSATFSRNDGLRLGSAIDEIVYHRDYIDMIDSGWLTDLVFTTVQSNVNLKRVKTSGNDFQLAALSAAVNTRPTNEIIVQAWKHRVGERKSTLVFCVDKAHVTSLTAMFRAHGVEAEYVTSDTTRSVRANRLEEFKAGRLPVLLNCGVFTEGTDIPNIDCVLLARPTKSQNLLVQMIGRGVRLHAGKKDCLVIDMVSSLATGIVTTPTLFGLDSDELVEHFNKEQMEDLRDRREKEFEQETAAAEAARPGSFAGTLDFTTYDSVHDLIADTSAERHIRGLSHLAWVNVGDGRHVLLNRGGDYIMIEPASTASDPAVKFAVRYMARLPEGAKAKAPYAKAREVARAQTFPEAVRAADTCADLAFERQFVLRRAAWRNAEASEKQLGFLNEMRDEGDLLTSTSVTKGEAADMITKVRFGARGRFKQGKREVEDRRKRFRAKR